MPETNLGRKVPATPRRPEGVINPERKEDTNAFRIARNIAGSNTDRAIKISRENKFGKAAKRRLGM